MPADPRHLDPSQLECEARKLRALARGLVGDAATADDLAQQAWLTALRNPPRPGWSLGAWLHGILRRHARQRQRDEARRIARERRAAGRDVDRVAPDPVEQLGRLDLLRHLLDEVRALDEPFRSAVLLRFFDGLDTAAAAARLGVPEATVRSRLHRGLERLRARLDQRTPGGRAAWLLPLATFAAAGLAGGSAAAASAGELTTTVTLTMNAKSKLLLAAAGLAALASLAVLLPRSAAGGDPEPTAGTGRPRAPIAAGVDARAAEAAAPRESSRERRAVERATAATGDRLAPVADRILVVLGRVVDAEGRPIGDALVEAARGEGPGDWWGAANAAGSAGSVGGKVGTGKGSDHDRSDGADSAAPKAAAKTVAAAGQAGSAERDLDPVQAAVRGRTDASGSYRVELPLDSGAPARVWVRATAAGHVGGIESLTASPPSLQVDFALRTARGLRGRVVDVGGLGVAGATVWTWDAVQRPATTDVEGRFLLDDLDPKRAEGWLVARADGFQPAHFPYTAPKDGGEPAPVEIVLRPGATLIGIVLAAGRPLADVRLALTGGKTETVARSGADGRFRFEGAPPGTQQLTANHPDHPPVTRAVEIPDPGFTTEVRIDLPRSREVLGTVRDADGGAPIVGARVSFRDGKSPVREVATDAAGAFLVTGLSLEDLQVACRAPGHLPLARSERVPSGVHRVELTLRRAARLAGTVVDAITGEPVTRFAIDVRPASAGTRPDEAGDGKGKAGSTGRSGEQIDHAQGHWIAGDGAMSEGFVADVTVRADGYAPSVARGLVARVEADPADHVTRLSVGAKLRGLVVSADGEPLAKARVRVGDGRRIGTSADGTFALEHAPHGHSEVTIEHGDWGVSRHALQIPADASAWQQTFRLPRQATLRGIVRDADGQPVPGARVRLTAVDAGPLTGRQWDDAADERGRCVFRGLPPGTYRIAKVATDGKAVETLARFVELVGDADCAIDLAGDPETTGSLRGTLTTPDGTPGEIWLRLEPLGDDENTPLARRRNARWVRTRDGVIAVPELTIGRYRIEASRFDDDLRGSLEIDVQPGDNAPVRIDLRAR
jgi:RNA polymerase sigma factor (sigma-70 family)